MPTVRGIAKSHLRLHGEAREAQQGSGGDVLERTRLRAVLNRKNVLLRDRMNNLLISMKTFLKNIFNPKYDELSLYSMTYCCLLGIIFNIRDFLKFCFPDHTSKEVPGQALVVIIVFSIMLLNIYHAFSRRKKRESEKSLMLLFAVILNGVCAIATGSLVFIQKNIWLYPFPIFNLINGFGILFWARFGLITEDNISDDNVDLPYIVHSTAVVSLVFIVCQFYYNYPFIITYSICMALNSMITNSIHPILLKNRIMLQQ